MGHSSVDNSELPQLRISQFWGNLRRGTVENMPRTAVRPMEIGHNLKEKLSGPTTFFKLPTPSKIILLNRILRVMFGYTISHSAFKRITYKMKPY